MRLDDRMYYRIALNIMRVCVQPSLTDRVNHIVYMTDNYFMKNTKRFH